MECNENRAIDESTLPTKTPSEAWNDLKNADSERDLDDLREAIRVYHKAEPTADWQQLENAFRLQKFTTYLIGYVSTLEVVEYFTLIKSAGEGSHRYVHFDGSKR